MTPMGTNLPGYATQQGQMLSRSPANGRPSATDTLRISNVAAIAKTPSLNASRRAVRTPSIQAQGSTAAFVKQWIVVCEYHEGLGLLLQPPHLRYSRGRSSNRPGGPPP